MNIDIDKLIPILSDEKAVSLGGHFAGVIILWAIGPLCDQLGRTKAGGQLAPGAQLRGGRR